MSHPSGSVSPCAAQEQVAHIRGVALGTFQASSAVLYWIDDRRHMVVADIVGPGLRHIDRYIRDMKPFDPLNIERLVSSGKRIATMSQDRHLAPASEFEHYCGYLRDSEVSDVLDFVFWRDGEPFAGLGILKAPGDPSITEETLRIASSLQPYLEFNLGNHPRRRDHRRQQQLRVVYGLTGREIEIAELISNGLTNHDIAGTLDIGLGTVKTHLLHVFQKLDVSNRTMLSTRLAGMGDEPASVS
ncbi:MULTISPECIES: helix-turn-helix domain-containing protein [Ancylobacter]|uniref:DNA-binding CsgD family transcriptional regulator n=2 Tax=Ancylobacter TaxID=99 RepID=A0A839ZCY7_9HYPH|nr:MULTISPECIES: helix-turn-helix transcriptional regulator [Ancylobacter]MBB3772599.1 DNA-binding CsgD family transcriptional regulator [Ancylobacter tetraedralis]MDQ0511823.1 DNA-binding CsgD family transcriptional regulator [Ancylobacter amanitiformis]